MPLERMIHVTAPASTVVRNDAIQVSLSHSARLLKPNEEQYALAAAAASATSARDFSYSALPTTASQALTMTVTPTVLDVKDEPQRISLSRDKIAEILGRALALVDLSTTSVDLDDSDTDMDDDDDDDDLDCSHELCPFGTRRDSIDDFRARSLSFPN